MNRLSWLAFLAATLIPTGAGAGTEHLDLLSWLNGSWTRNTKGGVSVESWSRVSDATMEGVVTFSRGDESIITESLRIELLGEDVFYTAKPRENDSPTAFRLVNFQDGSFVFQNPTHDFPQQIVYRRMGENSLVVEISMISDKAGKSIGFEFERVLEESRAR